MDDIEYGREKATIPLHCQIDEAAAERLVDALRKCHEEHFYQRIEISVRSGGGQLVALREILHEVVRLRELGVTVDTYVRGSAGSAAAFLAALGDRRRADDGSFYHFHHTRLGDVGTLTALGATSAGRNLARWDEKGLEDLVQRALCATPPAEPRIERLWGADWYVAAKLVSDTPLAPADEPDEVLRQDLYERLRAAVRDIVRGQAGDTLTRLYRDLFEAEMTISAGLARELLLVDEVGAAPTSVRAMADEPCLHVPEWAPLWPEGRVPTRLLCRHTLILGETGSGKTMSGIRPLLDALTAPDLPDGTVGCVLVVDPKKELWDTVSERGARLIDVGARGRTAVNLMGGNQWDVTGDVAAGRYLEAAERILIRSAALTAQSPANALAGRPSGGHSQYWQTDGARMARTALALTLAVLDNGGALFAGVDAAPLNAMSPRALQRLRAFGERAGLLVPHPELRAAASAAIERSHALAAAHPHDPVPRGKVLEAWEAFRTAVEGSDAHAELPALGAALDTWGGRLHETPGPRPLADCVRLAMAAALTRVADDRLRPAPSALALAAEAMKLLFSALPRRGEERIYGAWERTALRARYRAPREDSTSPGEGAPDEPQETEEDAERVLRRRLRLAEEELRETRNELDEMHSLHRSDPEPIAAVAVAAALVSVCGAAAEPLREEVEHWASIAGEDGRNSHYVGVRSFGDQAFHEFAAEAPAWTLYCGCEQYWRGIAAAGAGIVDFTHAVDRDAGRDVFVIQPGLGAARHGLVAKAIKALFFEAVLDNRRRAAGENLPLVGYIADEFHRFVTADSVHGEQSFLDTCRSFRAFCVLACQSMASVHHALAGVSGTDFNADYHAVDILLANTGSKMFFRTTDRDTLSRIAGMCPTTPGQIGVVDARPPSTLRAGECYASLPDGRFERRQIGLRPEAVVADPQPAPGPDGSAKPPPRKRKPRAPAREAKSSTSPQVSP